MSLALAKVFLWDAAALDGLVARRLLPSGSVSRLLLVAWLFQRFVGRAAPKSDPLRRHDVSRSRDCDRSDLSYN